MRFRLVIVSSQPIQEYVKLGLFLSLLCPFPHSQGHNYLLIYTEFDQLFYHSILELLCSSLSWVDGITSKQLPQYSFFFWSFRNMLKNILQQRTVDCVGKFHSLWQMMVYCSYNPLLVHMKTFPVMPWSLTS